VHFYRGRAELEAAIVPFLADGLLRSNERCLWITAPPLEGEDAIAALERSVPDVGDCIRRGQLEIFDYRSWYCRGGSFDAATVVGCWLAEERQALADGYAGLRVTGNMSWLDSAEVVAAFSAYEKTMQECAGGRRITCLCSYPLGP
jgi:hypothetical protein